MKVKLIKMDGNIAHFWKTHGTLKAALIWAAGITGVALVGTGGAYAGYQVATGGKSLKTFDYAKRKGAAVKQKIQERKQK